MTRTGYINLAAAALFAACLAVAQYSNPGSKTRDCEAVVSSLGLLEYHCQRLKAQLP